MGSLILVSLCAIASSDESTSSSEEGEGEGEECVRVLEWKPQRALGDWEKHTTVRAI